MIRITQLLAPLLFGLVGLSCTVDVSETHLDLSVSVDVAPGVQATSVRLTPGAIRLHVAGTPRSAGWTPEKLNDAYWIPIDSGHKTVELLGLEGETKIQLSHTAVPEGIYDHLFLEVDALEATDETGAIVPCKNVIEPIAIDLNLVAEKDIAINLELFIAADWPEDGHCSVLAKDATLLD